MELFRILANSISDKKEIIVKLHPRSGDSFAADYLQSKCEMAANVRVPWEVFEDNYTFNNNIWVTVSSTALCSLLMSFKNKTDDVKLIFYIKWYILEMIIEKITNFLNGYKKVSW